MNQITLEDGTLVQQLSYQVEGANGWFVRGFNKDRDEYLMMNSHFDEGFPKWFDQVKVPLVIGKGIPSALYMDLILMKKLNVIPEELKSIRICNVYEWESVFHLNRLSRDHDENTDLGELFRQTRLFRARDNVVIQTGLQIKALKIIMRDPKFSHPSHLKHQTENYVNEEFIKQLCTKYDIDYGNDHILWNFDVEFKVVPSRFN